MFTLTNVHKYSIISSCQYTCLNIDLNVCIYEYIINVFTYIYIEIHSCICTYWHMYIYIYMCLYMYICLFTFMHIYLCVCTYIHTYSYMNNTYIYWYLCIYIYLHNTYDSICSYMRYSTVLQLIQDWCLWLPSPWTNQSSTRFQGAIGMPLAMAAIAPSGSWGCRDCRRWARLSGKL